ncbi:MAG: hypothetical protein AAFO81_14320 [Pseudomonadota bacterium]
MSFHEKSAWVMIVVLLFASALYASAVNSLSGSIGQLAPPLLPGLVAYTVVIVVLSIIGHIAIALLKPSEASDVVDERDRIVLDRAGHWSGIVLGVGVITGLGFYLFGYNGDLLFYTVFGSLVLAQMAEYAFQIALYRLAV